MSFMKKKVRKPSSKIIKSKTSVFGRNKISFHNDGFAFCEYQDAESKMHHATIYADQMKPLADFILKCHAYIQQEKKANK